MGSILEMIPDAESLPEWTEMLTVQVFLNTRGWTLSGFRAGMEELWTNMCPCGSTKIIARGREQLHPMLIWSYACPRNKNTGKPENTWFKGAIRDGKIIVVQKAFKFQPSPEAVAFWIDFLKEVRVNHRL